MNFEYLKELPREVGLRIFSSDVGLVFEGKKPWLSNLIEGREELELLGEDGEYSELSLHDRKVGKAAALLIKSMNVKKVYADIISESGLKILEDSGVNVSYKELVESIGCKTEEIDFKSYLEVIKYYENAQD